MPQIKPLIDETEFVDDFEDNVKSDEFIVFIKVVIELNLHMVLSDPSITLDVVPLDKFQAEPEFLKRFEFIMYQKKDFYCIDGFPTERMPSIVVLPTPKRAKYTYQGLVPAVIVFNNDNLEDEELFNEGRKEQIMQHIKEKENVANEEKERKRALSAAPDQMRSKTIKP